MSLPNTILNPNNQVHYVTVSVLIESDSIDTGALSVFHDDKTHARLEGRLTTVQEIFASWISYLELNY